MGQIYHCTEEKIDNVLTHISKSCSCSTENEPPHDKTNKMACAPSEDSDQPAHPPSLITVFSIRMKKTLVLNYLFSTQRRLWSDWVDDEAFSSISGLKIGTLSPVCCRMIDFITNWWIWKQLLDFWVTARLGWQLGFLSSTEARLQHRPLKKSGFFLGLMH